MVSSGAVPDAAKLAVERALAAAQLQLPGVIGMSRQPVTMRGGGGGAGRGLGTARGADTGAGRVGAQAESAANASRVTANRADG